MILGVSAILNFDNTLCHFLCIKRCHLNKIRLKMRTLLLIVLYIIHISFYLSSLYVKGEKGVRMHQKKPTHTVKACKLERNTIAS